MPAIRDATADLQTAARLLNHAHATLRLAPGVPTSLAPGEFNVADNSRVSYADAHHALGDAVAAKTLLAGVVAQGYEPANNPEMAKMLEHVDYYVSEADGILKSARAARRWAGGGTAALSLQAPSGGKRVAGAPCPRLLGRTTPR